MDLLFLIKRTSGHRSYLDDGGVVVDYAFVLGADVVAVLEDAAQHQFEGFVYA